MHELNLFQLVILPIGLGLLGFVEPCSIGSSLVFIKYVEGQSAATRIAQVGVFALTRALFIGVLGAFVGLMGSIFLSLQKGAWLLLGVLYRGRRLLRVRQSRLPDAELRPELITPRGAAWVDRAGPPVRA